MSQQQTPAPSGRGARRVIAALFLIGGVIVLALVSSSLTSGGGILSGSTSGITPPPAPSLGGVTDSEPLAAVSKVLREGFEPLKQWAGGEIKKYQKHGVIEYRLDDLNKVALADGTVEARAVLELRNRSERLQPSRLMQAWLAPSDVSQGLAAISEAASGLCGHRPTLPPGTLDSTGLAFTDEEPVKVVFCFRGTKELLDDLDTLVLRVDSITWLGFPV